MNNIDDKQVKEVLELLNNSIEEYRDKNIKFDIVEFSKGYIQGYGSFTPDLQNAALKNLTLNPSIANAKTVHKDVEDAKNIIKYLYKTYKDEIFISIMNQYTPVNKCKFDNLNRKVSDDEYDDVVNYAIDLGVTNAFVQEGEAASESFIPEFNKDII